MTEQEIINYLKENKNKGVAFGFMPKDVKDWLEDNKKLLEDALLIYKDTDLGWYKARYKARIDNLFINTHILAIDDSFQIKKEQKGGWYEFEIEDGSFKWQINEDYVADYYWFQWQNFLKDSYIKDWGFTSFGGWLYDKSGDWVLSPQVGLIDDSGNAPFILNRYSYSYEKERITPVIPIKIRFWRSSK